MYDRAVVQLVENIARALVERPELITVEVEHTPERTVIRLRLPSSERGSVIGRGGITAKSIRFILEAISARQKHWYALDIEPSF